MAQLEPRPDAARDGEDGAVDEDFLYHLYRGGELLASGKNLEARDELERAYHLKPHNQKAQNLLGLVYFKLGLLDRAIEIYDRLVQDNPADPTLRINLGLVYLKAGQISDAIAQLEAAIAEIPDHPKALNYLGLAYAQAQSHEKARSAFARAGNPAMALKMEHALKDVAVELAKQHELTEESKALRPAPQAPIPEPEFDHASGHAGGNGAQQLPQPPSRFGRSGQPPLGLGELARFSVYDPPAALPFQVDAGGITLKVAGELRSRLSGLLWVRGEIQRQGEYKRFRGRATDKPFGDGADRVYRMVGTGQVLLAPQGLTFTPVELDDEAAYLVEDALFAFEDSLGYENGRVPSKTPPDLPLVHLRGRGKALLRSQGPLRSVEVRPGEPLQLPIDRLLGWLGPLTPTLLLPEGVDKLGPTPMGRWLRLEGEGWALWALPNKS